MEVTAAFASGQDRPIELGRFTLDGPREGEVLIALRAAGLCHSDMAFFDGSRDWTDYPIILGHEGAGVVEAVGPGVTTVRPGDHVIPVAIPECGCCPACRSGRTNLCDDYFRPARRKPFARAAVPVTAFCGLGTFASHIVVPETQVTPIRRDAPLDVVCVLACAGMTGLGAALYTARVEAGSSCVVFGLGGIGLNVVEGCRIAGATTIIGVDPNPAKEAAGRAVGVTHFLNPAAGGVVGAIREITGGGADYAFECAGHRSVLSDAVECTRIGWGTTVMIGVPAGGADIALRPRAMLEGRRLMGSYLGNVRTRTELPDLVELYMAGQLSLDGLISHRIRLEEIGDGFRKLAAGEARRVVIGF